MNTQDPAPTPSPKDDGENELPYVPPMIQCVKLSEEAAEALT